ncbi:MULTISPECIES: alpha-(1-_3)-arabinofuranosyltransferase domain-containing protein [unclassified Knoellia]|uniref:alpha-(1->3)-arabinofuranosyltransferase domain-containing protein n=1 Tax=Knoellia altitudinis TaxID=3404795 RepID=UPI00361AF091
MTPRPWLRAHAVVIVTAVLAGLLAIAVIAPSFGSLLPDTKPEVYLNPGRSFRDYIWPWQDSPGMGMASFNVGLAPVCALVWFLQLFGAEPWLSARLLRLLLLLLAGAGAAALVRRLPGLPHWRWTPLVAATLFVANPYTVTAGATLPVLLPLATLPWMTLFLWRALIEERSRSWVCAFGLAFAAGSGMNAGVVPIFQLLVVPAVVVMARTAGLVTWRRAGSTMTWCALWTVVLSLYWIVPTAGAQGSGSTVIATTESLQGIVGPSSLAESIRGLGLWPLYGGDAGSPWQPGFSAYLTRPFVVACSFLMPALVLAVGTRAPRAVRVGAVVMIGTAVVVMAGPFPFSGSAPFGRALTWVFEELPVAGAFRTTNKGGALLPLGMAVLGSSGIAVLWPAVAARLRRQRRGAVKVVAAAVTVAGIVAVGAFPLGTGGFYLARYDVPAYWREASAALHSAPAAERIWMVPGEKLANYRWATSSPDDVGRALIAPPSVVRTTVPNGSQEAANLLAAADAAFSDPDVAPETLATYARLLGAGRILARHDLAHEESGALPPQVVADRLAAVPGIRLEREFGAPGMGAGPSEDASEPLAPLQLFTVDRPGQVFRTRPATGSILLVGDAFAIPTLAAGGLMSNEPLISSLRSLSPAQALAELRAGARVVMTDTNRRSPNDTQRITAHEGPLVGAGAALSSTLAVGRPDQQTTLVVEGGSASTSLPAERVPSAQAAPENAFDGNELTTWQFGGFGQSDGQSVSRTFPDAERLDEVVVRTTSSGGRRITGLSLLAGEERRDAVVDADGVARVELGGVRADALTVTVTAVAGEGAAGVGISEIETPGPPLTRVAVLPTVVQQVRASLPDVEQDALVRAPLDILLSRENGGPGPADDEESSLNRDFLVSGDRNYFVQAMVQPSPRATDTDFDTLAGFSDAVTVQGSSRAFDLPTLRGSQALDRRADTAWIPSGGVGQTLTITSAEPRSFETLSVRQEAAPGAVLENWATGATVFVDGREVGRGTLGVGESTLRFPATVGREVRLQIDTTARTSGVIRVSEVDPGDLRMERQSGDTSGCVPVLLADGAPVLMRPQFPLVDLTSSAWTPCRGAGLPLADGAHRLRGTPAWSVDSLSLRDATGLEQPAPANAPPLSDVHLSPTRYSATTGVGSEPFTVVLAQGLSPGWQATLDGEPLPAPSVVDGFSMGWVVDDSSTPHSLEIVYAPRTRALVALALSLVATLLAALVILLGRLGPRTTRRASTPASPHLSCTTPARAGWRARSRRRELVAQALVLVLGGAVGGWIGLATALPIVVLLRLAAGPRLMGLVASGLVASTAAVWLTGNADRLGTVSPDLVAEHLAPHYVVLAAMLCLVASAALPDTSTGEDGL